MMFQQPVHLEFMKLYQLYIHNHKTKFCLCEFQKEIIIYGTVPSYHFENILKLKLFELISDSIGKSIIL